MTQRSRRGIGCRFRVALLLSVFASGLSLPVYAQVFDLRPTLDTRMTFSDNIRASDEDKRSGWVAEFSPGLAGGLSREGGRIEGRFSLSMQNIGYSNDDGWRSPGLGLQLGGEAEAIEDIFFIELDASVRRSNLSTFSGRSEDDFLVTERSNETRTLSLAPRLEFALGSVANARVRYEQTWFSGGSNALGSQRNGQWTADLESARAFGPFGWALNFTQSTNSFSDSDLRDVERRSARATLFYSVTPQLRLRANVGRERNDFGVGSSDSDRIVGAGFDWFPTPRTSVSGTLEDRFFGNGYDFLLSHRFARSTLSMQFGRDVTSSLQRFGSVYQDPLFNTFFNDPVFIALLPDEIDREAFVRQLLGLTGDSFISNAYFVSRNARLGYTINGVRNSISFSLSNNERSSVSSVTGLRNEDVFRNSNKVTTRSAAVSFSHRLTPRSSLNATLVRSTAESAQGLVQKTRRMTSSIGYTTTLGARSVAGISYRRQEADGEAGSDFTENVLTANFGMRF